MTDVDDSNTCTSSGRFSLRKLLWIGPLAMVVAIVANEIWYAIAAALSPSVGQWPGVGVVPIIISTVVYLVIASLVFAVVVRFSARPVRTYWIVATIALLISCAAPILARSGFGMPGLPPADTVSVIVLMIMHVIAFAISVPMITRLTRT
jgi:hypothetical protein